MQRAFAPAGIAGQNKKQTRPRRRKGKRKMDTEYFAQRIQCSRTDKQDLTDNMRVLMELAHHARRFGLLDLDRVLTEDSARYADPFLRKAVAIILDIGDSAMVRKVLYNYIVSSNFSGRHFLKAVVTSETVIAMMNEMDLDYIFTFLVPSYFGLEMDGYLQSVYRSFKEEKRVRDSGGMIHNG